MRWNWKWNSARRPASTGEFDSEGEDPYAEFENSFFELEAEQENPYAPYPGSQDQPPYERQFKPKDSGTIKSGRYATTSTVCSARLDAGMLKRRLTALSDQILLVRRLRNAKPPTNPKELDLQVQLFNRAVINATGALETMRKGVRATSTGGTAARSAISPRSAASSPG